MRAVHVLLADARDEFLGHLLENGKQHAQPTLAAAGDAYSNGASAQDHLPNGSAEAPEEGSAAAAELDQAAHADGLALLGTGQDQAVDRESSRGLSAEPDQDADAQQRGYSLEPQQSGVTGA